MTASEPVWPATIFRRSVHRVTVPAPAKLNLFLHVTGRRADGYHLLETLLVAVDVGDTITLTRRDDGAIVRTTELAGVAPQDDLAVRAAAALKRETGSAFGVDIALAKRVPLGSGMGGGSSDAASVLLALNRLWDANLPRAELMRLGVALGADVPFFLQGEPALARGIGERLTPVTLPPLWVAVIVPPICGRDRFDFRGTGIDTKLDVGENGSLFRGLWAQ